MGEFQPMFNDLIAMFPNTCLCDVTSNEWNETFKSFEKSRHTHTGKIGKNRQSKEHECIEILKEYKYEIETSNEDETGKERKMYKCKHAGCYKSFTIIWNLLDHVRMHKGVKPHECEVCHKRFTQMGNFRKHMRTHEDPDINKRKKHQCRICGRRYTEKYNLKVSI